MTIEHDRASSPRDPFIGATFPTGHSFAVRVECSDIAFDHAQQPIDDELASDMLLIKACKLAELEVLGHA
ncbi:MAG TPA: hypothetical protein VMV19_17605 [Xanthobacteraceae bacterium]|nr:hypothetical protein [Xanthobacteraceae bacterium]